MNNDFVVTTEFSKDEDLSKHSKLYFEYLIEYKKIELEEKKEDNRKEFYNDYALYGLVCVLFILSLCSCLTKFQ